jgi:diguanylate cyclase (GGDEF)-like protein
VGSFKFKLVAYFLLLSLLPLTAAYLGFRGMAERGVTASADARLEAGLRAAAAAYEDERRTGQRAAEQLAREPAFQRALTSRNRVALRRLLADTPNLRVEAAGLAVGRAPARAAETHVSVVLPDGTQADVVSALPLGRSLVARLRSRSGLAVHDQLALVHDGSVTASTGAARGRFPLAAPHVRDVEVGGGRRYRALQVRLYGDEGVSLAALTPQSVLEAEQTAVKRQLLLWLAASLLLIAVIAYAAGRSIVGALARLAAGAHGIAEGRLGERVRVRGRDEFASLGRAFNEMAAQLESRLEELEAERARLREANVRFGDALAATLDQAELRRVIVETAVEATSAAGGLVTAPDGAVVVAGDPASGAERLEFPLTASRGDFGTLVLVGEGFTVEDRVNAASLAGQAVVALENARLHRIVERQALVDGLTGLANRRHADDSLVVELARAERFGAPLALILADLDDFKSVNDRYGHPTGDHVLREFAETLRGTVREIDLAARWGGEEFAVLAPGTDLDGAVQLAERIRAALEARVVRAPDGSRIAVTASFGVAAAPAESTPAELVGAADEALYGAKHDGKNRVVARNEAVRPA